MWLTAKYVMYIRAWKMGRMFFWGTPRNRINLHILSLVCEYHAIKNGTWEA